MVKKGRPLFFTPSTPKEPNETCSIFGQERGERGRWEGLARYGNIPDNQTCSDLLRRGVVG